MMFGSRCSLLVGLLNGLLLLMEMAVTEVSYSRKCIVDILANLTDSAFSSSSHRASDTGSGPGGFLAHHAKLEQIMGSEGQRKAWCPGKSIDRLPSEWLQIDFPSLHLINMILSKGRLFGNSEQFVEKYQIRYQREDSDSWIQYFYSDGKVEILANQDSHNHIRRTLEKPIVARRIRFYPVVGSQSRKSDPRSVCFKLKIYGCPFTDGIVEYRAPEGFRGSLPGFENSHFDFRDVGYDVDAGQQSGGLGLLTDNLVSEMDAALSVADVLNASQQNRLPGIRFLGWQSNALLDSVRVVLRLHSVHSIHAIHIHLLHAPEVGIAAPDSVAVGASVQSEAVCRAGSNDPPWIRQIDHNALTTLSWISLIPPEGRLVIGRLVCLRLKFSSPVLLMDEVVLNSSVYPVSFNEIDRITLLEMHQETQASDRKVAKPSNRSSAALPDRSALNQPEPLLNNHFANSHLPGNSNALLWTVAVLLGLFLLFSTVCVFLWVLRSIACCSLHSSRSRSANSAPPHSLDKLALTGQEDEFLKQSSAVTPSHMCNLSPYSASRQSSFLCSSECWPCCQEVDDLKTGQSAVLQPYSQLASGYDKNRATAAHQNFSQIGSIFVSPREESAGQFIDYIPSAGGTHHRPARNKFPTTVARSRITGDPINADLFQTSPGDQIGLNYCKMSYPGDAMTSLDINNHVYEQPNQHGLVPFDDGLIGAALQVDPAVDESIGSVSQPSSSVENHDHSCDSTNESKGVVLRPNLTGNHFPLKTIPQNFHFYSPNPPSLMTMRDCIVPPVPPNHPSQTISALIASTFERSHRSSFLH